MTSPGKPARPGLLVVSLFILSCASAGSAGPALSDDGGVPGGDGGVAQGSGGVCNTVDDCMAGLGCVSGHCDTTTRFQCRFDLAPIVQVEPTQLDFGSVRVGNRVERQLRVRNIGSCNLN